MSFDPVEHPKHYSFGSLECIDWIEAELTYEEFEGYLKGQVFKYLWRYRDKGNKSQDLKKARWYLNKLIEKMESEEAEEEQAIETARAELQHCMENFLNDDEEGEDPQ